MAQKPLRIALTADLHYGVRDSGDKANHELAAHLEMNPVDLLVLAGDIGAGDDFERCLALFGGLKCRKALVPGNHDIWVYSDDARGDSLKVYREHLPALSSAYGFHYLDNGPLVLADNDLAVAGSMNWYDWSWSLERLKEVAPDWQARLQLKHFTRGRHNDYNYVRWPHTDASFTAEAVGALEKHLDEALAAASNVMVVTHHPAFRALNYPKPEPKNLNDLLWEAFSGNVRLEESLRQRAERIRFAFSGHTHHAVEGAHAGIRGYNIGGDYHFKRLLWLDWPAGDVRAVTFGAPG